MRTQLIAAGAVLALGTLLVSGIVAPRRASALLAQASAERKEVSPFYCNVRGLNPEQRKRKTELDQALRSLRTGARELADGYEIQFPSDSSTFQTVAEWAAMERSCCPFFDIELRLQREGGPFRLRLTGRDGVKAFMRAEFRPEWLK